MKKGKLLFYLFFSFLLFFVSLSVFSQARIKTNNKPLGVVTASFTAPDTVCTNTSVQINNTSVGATSYYWSFCEASFNTAPTGTDLGNPGGLLSLPVYTDIAQDASGNYFAFVVNNFPGGLIRLSFGNSLLNAPTADNMGNFGGAIPQNAEGIQAVNINGDWLLIIDGGDPGSGGVSSILKIDLGTSLASTTGVATNWGNVGNMDYPHDLYLFTENNNWYGYTVNSENNTLTLLNFGADFSGTPTGVNLGDLGNMNVPVGLGVINNAGNWYLFVANNQDNTITRINFGNSLLNMPTGVNIGNPGNALLNPRDISFVQLCNNTEAYIVNGTGNNITQLDFGNNITGTPIVTNLGNVGNLNFPHSISKFFRVNSDVYAFVPNVYSNGLSLLHFSGCSTPGSTLQNPANVTYSTPGTYNINLMVDVGLPTQTSYCKQIVVKDCPLGVCNDWLYTPTQPSAVEVGQLNITGSQITVEAQINRTTPYVGGTLYAGDVVSKHSGPADANYLLRPNEAEITTTDGYFRTPDICEIELNKTYHVAMTYDGTTLKFYRDGFLMSSVPATGTLYQNTWATRIGYYVQGLYNENFIGYTNEVRIWNVVRTQAQIKAYMNTSLPSPATQIGLLAYYIFNDLTNKQGNTAWNGSLVGTAIINQTNPQCTYVPDSCCAILTGTITGESLCKGDNATLTFNTTTGTAPYILTYSDGTNTFTQNNVQNNVPFILSTQPTANTTYTLLSIQDASPCPPTNISGITTAINVESCTLTCTNWLYTPTQPSAVEIGQLNITGNQITVEAEINRTTPYVGGTLYAGDVVSKHGGPTDANYLLRPNDAEITTSDGYFKTPDICEIQLNKTYHVAMTYDGATLKFYRNGFLMSSVPATGTLYQNTWATRIGYYVQGLYNENFIGYTNEVRIWNVVRTQAQIQAYMNTSLPSPSTQTGLLAYYIFNDLNNKQGNSTWNGSLIGTAVINQTNPQCTFIADSCCPVLTGTLAGESLCKGSNATLTFNTTTGTTPYTLTISDGTNTYSQSNVRNNVPFILSTQPTANTTYTLLSIQDSSSCPPTNITGVTATINVNNCSLCKGSLGDPVVNITFGTGDNPGSPIPSIVPGATTSLTYVAVTGNPATPTPLDGQYTITTNVPSNPSWFSGAHDHTPFDVNGYMAFYNASEQPGEFYSQTVNNLCGSTTYEFAAWIANALNPAITIGVNPNITFYIEQTDGTILASYNTGDILQTNVFTWKQYGFLFTTPANISGVVLKMVNNNPGGTANVGNDLAIDDITFRPCGPVTSASFSSTVFVDTLKTCQVSTTTLYGTVSAGYTNPSYLWQVSFDSGATWVDLPNSNTLNLILNNNKPGIQSVYEYRLLTAEGGNINSLNCRIASNPVVLFINANPVAKLTANDICNGDNAVLLFIDSSGAAPFNIKYGNGTNFYTVSNISNDSALIVPYNVTDTTIFTLITVTDANGCVDSANTTSVIDVAPLPQGSISGNAACAGDSAIITFTSTSGNAPFTLIINDGINSLTYNNILSGIPFKIEPLINTTTISLVSVASNVGKGCARTTGFTTPSIIINVSPSPQIQFDSLGSICIQNPPFEITQAKEISGIAGSGILSGQGVDATGTFSPLIAGAGIDSITYTYTANNGCITSKTEPIIVNKNPVANAGPDLIACINVSLQLNATGGESYAWTPPTGLSNDSISNPMATLTSSTTYTVTVTDVNGCAASDSVVITVSTLGKQSYVVPNAFTPNGDGKNDCFGIQHWGGVTLHEFVIFNRWGQLVFSTKNPSECWNGIFNGKIQDAGAYVYIIRAETPCGEVSLKGTVVLVR